MIATIQTWLRNRSDRERHTLYGGAGLLLLLLIWSLFWQPLISERQQLSRLSAAAQDDIEWMAAASEKVKRAKSSARPAINLPPEVAVTRAAGRHNLLLTRMEPADRGRIEVYFDQAAYTQFVRFVAELENTGIAADRLNIKRLPNKGYVKVRLRLRTKDSG